MSWHSVRGHDRVVESLQEQPAARAVPARPLVRGPRGDRQAHLRPQAGPGAPVRDSRRQPSSTPARPAPAAFRSRRGTHPDFIEAAKPEDKHELPISVIRDLCDQFALKPARGAHKVAILDDADDLNEEASNAFLKTLEEPPPGAVLILIGTSAELQLETIVSRCQVVRFDPLPESEIAALLLEQGRRARRRRRGAAGRAGRGERQPRHRPGRRRARAVSPVVDRRDRRRARLRSPRPGSSAAGLHQAGGQGIGRPAAPGQPVDRRAGPVLPRRLLADRRTGTPLPRPRRPPGRRSPWPNASSPRTSSSSPTAASRPTTTFSAGSTCP